MLNDSKMPDALKEPETSKITPRFKGFDFHDLINAFLLIGQPLLLNLISVPVLAYIIRSLGAYNFGQWSISVSLIATVSFFASLGLRPLFVRSVAQYPESASLLLAEQLGLRGVLSVFAGLAAICLCLLMGYPTLVLKCVVVSSLGLVLSAFSMTFADALQGLQKLRIYSFINFIAGFLLTAASFIAAYRRANPLGLAFAYLTGPFTSCLLYLLVLRKIMPIQARWNFKKSRELLKESKQIGVSGFIGILRDRTEQLLIPKLVGIADFGFYSAGSMPIRSLGVFPDSMVTLFYPKIAHASLKDEKSAMKYALTLLTISFVVAIPLLFLVVSLSAPVSRILFPKNSIACQRIIVLTMWSLPFQGLSMSIYAILQAMGRYNVAARLNSIGTVISSIITIYLIEKMGLVGGCWSLLIRQIISLMMISPIFIKMLLSAYRPLSKSDSMIS